MKLTRGEKKLLALSLFAVGLPLSLGLWVNHLNATPIIQISPYPTAPKPNGYDFYLQAANAIIAVKPAVSVATDNEEITDPKVAAWRYSLKRKNAWLAQNKVGFALFNRAMELPTLAPPMREINSSSAARAALRQLARHKLAQSDACWMRGDADGALRSGLDIVQMGHQMRRGGISDFVFGISISAMGRATNSATVERLNATQAQNAARRLEKMLAMRYSLERALTEDKHSSQAIWMKIFQQPNWRRGMADSNLQLISGESFLVHSTSKQKIIDDIGALSDAQIATARLPYPKQKLLPPDINDPLIENYMGTGESGRFLNARDLAGDELLMLRLALRAYRLQTGVYPADLKALTPTILKSIPVDPFGNGEIWRYQRNGENYLLWSIGPDGVDDEGESIVGKTSPRLRLGERPQLPVILPESKGDYVAGHNH